MKVKSDHHSKFSGLSNWKIYCNDHSSLSVLKVLSRKVKKCADSLMPVGEPLVLCLIRPRAVFSNPCSWNFQVGSKKQTIKNTEQKLARKYKKGC